MKLHLAGQHYPILQLYPVLIQLGAFLSGRCIQLETKFTMFGRNRYGTEIARALSNNVRLFFDILSNGIRLYMTNANKNEVLYMRKPIMKKLNSVNQWNCPYLLAEEFKLFYLSSWMRTLDIYFISRARVQIYRRCYYNKIYAAFGGGGGGTTAFIFCTNSSPMSCCTFCSFSHAAAAGSSLSFQPSIIVCMLAG